MFGCVGAADFPGRRLRLGPAAPLSVKSLVVGCCCCRNDGGFFDVVVSLLLLWVGDKFGGVRKLGASSLSSNVGNDMMEVGEDFVVFSDVVISVY